MHSRQSNQSLSVVQMLAIKRKIHIVLSHFIDQKHLSNIRLLPEQTPSNSDIDEPLKVIVRAK